MHVFGVQRNIAAPARVLAATYAHNQLFYDQADTHLSHRKRWAPAQAAQTQMRKAASNIASVLRSARELQDAAAALRETQRQPASQGQAEEALDAKKPQGIREQLRQLLAAYNAALHHLDEAKPYVKRALRNQLSQAADGFERYGIRQLADGTLEMDDSMLEAQMDTNPDSVVQALAGQNGLADRLKEQAERIAREPASAMLHARFHPKSPLPSYQYHSLRGNTFQSGLLLDLAI